MRRPIKNKISVMLCIILCLTLLPISVRAAQSGLFEYSVSGGKATITEYNGNAKKVDIPSRIGGYPVTAIGEDAFWYNTDIESVTVPEGVTTIEDSAFVGCQSLKSISIPSSVTFIGDSAFSDCKSIRSISLPEGITSIGEFTFAWCESLSAITLPSSLRSIGENAFWCAGITGITIPAGVTSIGLDAFTACDKLSAISVSDNNPNYKSHDGALYNKAMTSLIAVPGTAAGVFVIPSGVSSIEIRAFYDCSKITGIILPKSVKSVDKSAFAECGKLKKVYYYGSSTDKKAISVDNAYEGNDPFLKSSWIFNFKGYIDVIDPTAWYYDAVYWAKENEITTGTTPTTFSPNAACTRAQIVTFLWRVKGEPEPRSYANPFRDVPSDKFYYKAVLWAYHEGITTGTSATTFGPNQACTRAQCVTFLWRAAGSPNAAVGNKFKDVKGDAWYAQAVYWAYSNGITTGTSGTAFSPNTSCSRAQIVTFLYRYAG